MLTDEFVKEFNLDVPYLTKAIIVGTLTILPMLFSGIIFVRSFAIAKENNNALGANLSGALAGAVLQSVMFISRLKALPLVVAGFYLLSLLTAPEPSERRARLIEEFAK